MAAERPGKHPIARPNVVAKTIAIKFTGVAALIKPAPIKDNVSNIAVLLTG